MYSSATQAFSPLPTFGGMDEYTSVAYTQDNLNVPDLIYLPSSPDSSSSASIASPRTPYATTLSEPLPTESSPEGPSRVPRPRNAFIIFRSEYASLLKARGVQTHQNLVSRDAADAWNALTAEEKLPYKLQATEEKNEHRKNHPNYVYTPAIKRGASAAARRSSKPYSLPAKKSSKCSKAKDVGMPLDISAPAPVQAFEQQIAAPSTDIIPPEPMLTHFTAQNYIPSVSASQTPAEGIDWQFGLGLESTSPAESSMAPLSAADVLLLLDGYQPDSYFDPSLLQLDTNFGLPLDMAAAAPSHSQVTGNADDMSFFDFLNSDVQY